MRRNLNDKVEDWYKESPKRAVSLKLLWNSFRQETGNHISYDHFRQQSNKVTKVQSIKTGGYYVRFNNFVDMTVSRAMHNVNMQNTICIDEKPFAPRKYKVKNLRIHKSFRGRGTANLVKCTDQLYNISPVYLLCAISHNTVVQYYLSDSPIDTDTFNSFLWKLSDNYPNNNQNLFYLCDNASFHGIQEITQNHINNNNCFITRTAALGCFTNPIEEFFSIVHNNFECLLGQRFISDDSSLTKEEYYHLIEESIIAASRTCNYKMIYARAGLF